MILAFIYIIMSQNIFASSSQSMSREQRWELRKQAKFQQGDIQKPLFQNNFPDQEIKVAPTSSNYQQAYIENSISTNNNPYSISTNYAPEVSTIQQLNPIPNNNEVIKPFQKKMTPPSSSFFLNPISEAENKRNQALQDYRNEAKHNISLPVQKNRDRPNSRTQIITNNSSDESLKKKAYAYELQQQIMKKKNINEKRKSITEEYFPFGKPGAGAPFRDNSGNIIAVRPPKYNENDPNFMSPNQFYKKLGNNNPGLNRNFSQPELMRPNELNRQQVYQDAPPPQYYQPYSQNSQPMPPPVQYTQPMPPPAQYTQSIPAQYSQYPPTNYSQPPPQYIQSVSPQGYQAEYNPPQYGNQYISQNGPNPAYVDRNISYQNNLYQNAPSRNPEPIIEQDSRMMIDNNLINQIRSNSDSPNPGNKRDPNQGYEKIAQKDKQSELARTLLVQMEEKKRQKEEEKRQKILEERLEEERLARQRREIDEGFQREAMNKRKQFQDLQDFNSKLAVMAPIQKKPRTPIDIPMNQPQRKTSTPIEFPPPMPLAPKSTVADIKFQSPQEYHSEALGNKQYIMDTEIQKLKQEFGSHQNELKQEILKLKTENMNVYEQRFEAQKELEKIREEMRQKEFQEDLRQTELLTALLNTKNNVFDSNTKFPPYKPVPYKFPQPKSEASLSLDPMKSLPSQTKLIPLAQVEENFPTLTTSQPNDKLKKALNLDSLFPSLPDSGPNNLSYDSIKSVNSSIGLDKVNKKNDQRLKMLEKCEANPNDELNKLDDILLKYIEDNNSKKPETGKWKNKREYKLMSIEEEEAELSLPKTPGSSNPSLKWFKDWDNINMLIEI